MQLQKQIKKANPVREPRSRGGTQDRQPHHHHGRRADRAVGQPRGHRAEARQRLCARLHRQRESASVLTAWNVMRPLHDLERDGEGWVWLDKRRTTRFRLGADGKVVEAERDGQKAQWVSCDDVEKPAEPGARPSTGRGPARRSGGHAGDPQYRRGAVAIFDEKRQVPRRDRRQERAAGGAEAAGVAASPHPASLRRHPLPRGEGRDRAILLSSLAERTAA